ncbi:MAG: DUF3575 domain-containing protein [Alistipes sp.]|jgi:hypothetical protein|nr:DUF3575 domain-containing protein [Alistipes sp.]
MTSHNLIKIALAALLLCATAVATTPARAQKVAIKTNLLYWATGTVNFAGEFAVKPRMTIDLTATSNLPGVLYYGDKAQNKKLWHWAVQPEVRFWHTEAFNRGFWGIHATTGAFDAGGIKMPGGILPNFANHRYEGWMVGAGISYGWQWFLSPHWNVEATIGAGYLYLKYNRFFPQTAIEPEADQIDAVQHYIGPTRVGITFSYLLRSKK